MNTGPCIGGPQNGNVIACPAASFLQVHISKPYMMAFAFGQRPDWGPLRFTLYRWRGGRWIWEHYQERDDLALDRN